MRKAVNSEWKTSNGKNGFQSARLLSPRLRPEVLKVITGIMMRWSTTTPTRTGWAKNPGMLPQPITMSSRNRKTLRGMPSSWRTGTERAVPAAVLSLTVASQGASPPQIGSTRSWLDLHPRQGQVAVVRDGDFLPLAAHVLEHRHVLAGVVPWLALGRGAAEFVGAEIHDHIASFGDDLGVGDRLEIEPWHGEHSCPHVADRVP